MRILNAMLFAVIIGVILCIWATLARAEIDEWVEVGTGIWSTKWEPYEYCPQEKEVKKISKQIRGLGKRIEELEEEDEEYIRYHDVCGNLHWGRKPCPVCSSGD